MRNLVHIASLLAAMMTWLLGVYLGFNQPLLGFAGTCCTLGLIAVALKTSEDPALSSVTRKASASRAAGKIL